MTTRETNARLRELAGRFPHLDITNHAAGVCLVGRTWKGFQAYANRYKDDMHKHDLWASIRLGQASGWVGVRVCIAREIGEDAFHTFLETITPTYQTVSLTSLEQLLTGK